MFWQKVGYASFMAFIVGALVTARPDAVLKKSGGCTGVSGANGVIVDAQGVLHNNSQPDPGGDIWRERHAGGPGPTRRQSDRRQQAAQGLAQSAGSGDQSCQRQSHCPGPKR